MINITQDAIEELVVLIRVNKVLMKHKNYTKERVEEAKKVNEIIQEAVDKLEQL